ncbi:MAG: 2'-5' RNA ligase family protein, partial [Anaerolineales bacterium]
LCALQAAVEEGAAALGFRTEGRDFTPHLTLGRVNERQWPADQAKLTEALAQSQALSFGSFVADHISLVRSELKPLGPVYTQLFAAPLNERIE